MKVTVSLALALMTVGCAAPNHRGTVRDGATDRSPDSGAKTQDGAAPMDAPVVMEMDAADTAIAKQDTKVTPDPDTPPEPDTAVPDTAVPDTAVPDSAVPDTADPDTAVAEPDAAGPDATTAIPGLVGYWKFDENAGTAAADSSPTMNQGTLVNDPPWSTTTFPGATFTNAASLGFDGVDDRVDVAMNLAGVLGGTASLSVWIKTTQVGSDTPYAGPGITGVEQNGGDNDIFWGSIDASGRIKLQAGDGAGAVSSAAVNDDQWHHVVMTRDKDTGHEEVWVDAALGGSADGVVGVKDTPFSALGRITDSSAPYYQGLLDDLRIYDRVLTPSEIAQLRAGAN